MFGYVASGSAVLTVLNRWLAIIEFDPTGTILTANENFCNALGYSLSEIKGQHQSMFVESDYVRSPEYKAFWSSIAASLMRENISASAKVGEKFRFRHP